MMASRLAFGVLLVLLGVVPSNAQQSGKPTLVAFYSAVSRLPAFWVGCGSPSGVQSFRLDGVVPRAASGGSTRSRLGAAQDPPHAWRGVFAFSTDDAKDLAGAARQIDAAIGSATGVFLSNAPVSPGPHRLAVECGGAWSDEMSFFWNP